MMWTPLQWWHKRLEFERFCALEDLREEARMSLQGDPVGTGRRGLSMAIAMMTARREPDQSEYSRLVFDAAEVPKDALAALLGFDRLTANMLAWLAQATGRTPEQILEALAITMDRDFPGEGAR